MAEFEMRQSTPMSSNILNYSKFVQYLDIIPVEKVVNYLMEYVSYFTPEVLKDRRVKCKLTLLNF